MQNREIVGSQPQYETSTHGLIFSSLTINSDASGSNRCRSGSGSLWSIKFLGKLDKPSRYTENRLQFRVVLSILKHHLEFVKHLFSALRHQRKLRNHIALTDRTTNAIILVGGIAVLLAIIGAIYGLGSALISAFSGLDAKFGAALVVAAGTVIVSVMSVVVSRFLETRTTIRKELREKKIPVYEDLISFMFKILMASKTGDEVTEQDMLKFMSDFTQRSMVWASDDVLNAWIKFRGASTNEAEIIKNPFLLMFVYEDLIRAIRKDLGHKNKDLSQGKLLSLFINDIADYVDENGNIKLPANVAREQSNEPKSR